MSLARILGGTTGSRHPTVFRPFGPAVLVFNYLGRSFVQILSHLPMLISFRYGIVRLIPKLNWPVSIWWGPVRKTVFHPPLLQSTLRNCGPEMNELSGQPKLARPPEYPSIFRSSLSFLCSFSLFSGKRRPTVNTIESTSITPVMKSTLLVQADGWDDDDDARRW